jgi:hypothetical protein
MIGASDGNEMSANSGVMTEIDRMQFEFVWQNQAFSEPRPKMRCESQYKLLGEMKLWIDVLFSFGVLVTVADDHSRSVVGWIADPTVFDGLTALLLVCEACVVRKTPM